jgi:hypothetical protein
MKYRTTVYNSFDAFISEAVEIAKDRLSLYNQLVDPPVRRRLKNKGFSGFINSIIFLIRNAGWKLFLMVVALIALGAYAFYGGIGTLIALNPLLAAALVVTSGGGIFVFWKNRDIMLALEVTGKYLKEDFEEIIRSHENLEDRIKPIESLMKIAIKKICIEVFQVSSNDFFNRVNSE